MADIVVYVACNILNGHEYIGVTSGGIKKRRREHFCAARTGSRFKFHNAIRKYGEDSFKFSILEIFDDYSKALAREVELISDRRPYYNLTAGGQGSLGCKFSKEVRERLAELKRGSVGYWRGKKRPEAADWLRNTNKKTYPKGYWYGKKRSQETKDKISATKTRASRKLVECFNDGSQT